MNKQPENEVRKRRHLSAEEKFQIFLEATLAKAEGKGSVGEIMRRWGIHSSDLVRIRKTVEQGALGAFQDKRSRRPKVDNARHQELKQENERLQSTIVELSAELALIKKKLRLA
jgi:transposase-like protein